MKEKDHHGVKKNLFIVFSRELRAKNRNKFAEKGRKGKKNGRDDDRNGKYLRSEKNEICGIFFER